MKPTAFKPRFSFPYVFPPVTVVNRSSRNIFFLLYVIHIYLRQVPVKLRQRLFPVLPFWRLELINRSPIANRELVPPFHSRRGFLSVYLTYIYRKILVFFLGRRQGKRPATASNPPPPKCKSSTVHFLSCYAVHNGMCSSCDPSRLWHVDLCSPLPPRLTSMPAVYTSIAQDERVFSRRDAPEASS